MPRTFSDDERVAAKNDGDMVVPTGEPTALVVIEAELSLEILIDPLGPPALHDQSHELLACHLVRERAEEVVRGLRFSVAPLDQEPDRLTAFDDSIVPAGFAGPDAPAKSEPRGERPSSSMSPGRARSRSAPAQSASQPSGWCRSDSLRSCRRIQCTAAAPHRVPPLFEEAGVLRRCHASVGDRRRSHVDRAREEFSIRSR
jgi:hypothetical protein